MGLGPILERHNAFQWDLATAADADTAAAARCGYSLSRGGQKHKIITKRLLLAETFFLT